MNSTSKNACGSTNLYFGRINHYYRKNKGNEKTAQERGLLNNKPQNFIQNRKPGPLGQVRGIWLCLKSLPKGVLECRSVEFDPVRSF
jgi:hypothetical protein